MTPFFSILVVCLNAGSKLEQTITSIQAQDFTDYEIIVKDGGWIVRFPERAAADPAAEGQRHL